MSHDPLAGLLRSFNLTTMASIYADTLAQAEQHHWGYRKFLQHLCESEAEDRPTAHRSPAQTLRAARRQKLWKLGRDPVAGKNPTTITHPAGRRLCRAWRQPARLWVPGRRKSHFVAALCRELILRHGQTVQFIPTFKLVQKLLTAKTALKLEALLKKLDRYAVVALDDIGYVQQDREEMEVLFTFLAERYERRSVMITSNLVFSKWDKIFKDPMTTMAAIDRLVHHATILEFDGESVRTKKAKSRQTA